VNVRPDQAKKLVLVSLIGLLGLAAYRGASGQVAGDVGLAKRLWGVGALGLFLTVAADVAPSLAGPFAVLVLIGYATDGGDAAIQNFLGKVSGSPAPAGHPGVNVTPAPTPPGVKAPPPAKPGTNP
jgi:hypothetical protein